MAADADMSGPLDHLLFNRGFFPHPGDSFPRPASENGPVQARVLWDEPPQDGGTFAGNIFVDGSCHRREISELSRAGYGLVALGDDGRRLGRLLGPVHAPFPQTSQCSEFAGIAR
eukprot:2814451-Pyramimonas_sp.AAC.1